VASKEVSCLSGGGGCKTLSKGRRGGGESLRGNRNEVRKTTSANRRPASNVGSSALYAYLGKRKRGGGKETSSFFANREGGEGLHRDRSVGEGIRVERSQMSSLTGRRYARGFFGGGGGKEGRLSYGLAPKGKRIPCHGRRRKQKGIPLSRYTGKKGIRTACRPPIKGSACTREGSERLIAGGDIGSAL